MAIRFATSVLAKLEASPNKPVAEVKKGKWDRNARWRKANPEAYRSYMRDYMRKKRAAALP